ncbi:MAG: response regulator [Bacteroidota bacterium]|nr:response regulator [Bacteroidota bacterium]
MSQQFPHLPTPVSIVIIDDDPITIFLAKKTLFNFDPEIIISSFNSGETAIKTLLKQDIEQPHFILLDINMPRYNGWNFLNDYTKIKSSTKIFMFTSSVDPNDYIKSKTYEHVKGFISKPLDMLKIKNIFESL